MANTIKTASTTVHLNKCNMDIRAHHFVGASPLREEGIIRFLKARIDASQRVKDRLRILLILHPQGDEAATSRTYNGLQVVVQEVASNQTHIALRVLIMGNRKAQPFLRHRP